MTTITPESSIAYKTAVKQVAEQWNDTLPDYTTPLGSAGVYFAMRQHLTDRLIETDPDITELAKSISHQAGIQVIGRFFYIGAAKAAQQGIKLDELTGALYQPASFRQLIPLTREHNASARRIETEVGLTDHSYAGLSHFKLSDAGLVIKDYSIHRYIARSNLYQDGQLTSEEAYTNNPDTDPIRCAGFTAGLITYAYKYMLDICVKDTALFESTLSTNTTYARIIP